MSNQESFEEACRERAAIIASFGPDPSEMNALLREELWVENHKKEQRINFLIKILISCSFAAATAWGLYWLAYPTLNFVNVAWVFGFLVFFLSPAFLGGVSGGGDSSADLAMVSTTFV